MIRYKRVFPRYKRVFKRYKRVSLDAMRVIWAQKAALKPRKPPVERGPATVEQILK